jgi:DNA-binding CsgD family transcriptional regulator
MSAEPEIVEYRQARDEHALLLRAEGATLREISRRLGVSENTAYYKLRRLSLRKNGKDKIR